MTGPLVIVGDAFLDVDLVGCADRLCPDAPVPVLHDLVEHARPGGAGLATTMAARDGREVVLVTAFGEDGAGRRLADLLDVEILRVPYDGPTPVKTRVRSGGQSLLRLDAGHEGGRYGEPDERVATALAGVAGILVSDYGRGLTSVPAMRRLLASCTSAVPVTWDPHPKGAAPVPGLRLATPNETEAAGSVQHPTPSATVYGRAGSLAAALVTQWQAQAVALTLGARGAMLSYGAGAPVVVPAPAVTALDVCGAGDRFAVTAAAALAAGALTSEAVQLAVQESAAYVGAGGPASLHIGAADPAHLPQRTGVVVATGGCFDLLHAGHVATLRAARDLGDHLVVLLNSDDSVRRLKGPGRPLVPAADRARVLEALECVDEVVVFDEDTPVEALRRLRPALWVKGGDYTGQTLPETAVLDEWGGQSVVLPYLQGRSTSQLVVTAKESLT